MAKWRGGRGTIAYAQFPDDWQEAMKPFIPDRKETNQASATEAPAAPKEIEQGKITIDGFDVRLTKVAAGYVTYSWKVEVLNGTEESIAIRPEVFLLDGDGFEVDSTIGDQNLVRAGTRKMLTGTGIVSEGLWDETKNFRVKLR